MKYFQLNILKSFKALRLAALFLFIGVILTILFVIKDGHGKFAIVFTLIPGILYFMPTLIVWLQYIVNDYKKALSVENGVFSYFNFKSSEKFSFGPEDISRIRVVKRNVSGDLGMPWFPWHYFSYTEIELKDRRIIRFSFLTLPNSTYFGITPEVVNRPLPYMNT